MPNRLYNNMYRTLPQNCPVYTGLYVEANACYGSIPYQSYHALLRYPGQLHPDQSCLGFLPESRKRKREDFSIRGLLNLPDDEGCSRDCPLLTNDRAKVQKYSPTEASSKNDILIPPYIAPLCCTPPARDIFLRYEPASPVSTEPRIPPVLEANIPNKSDSPSLPTGSADLRTAESSDSCSSSDGLPSPTKKSKRIRTIFSPQQLEKLEQEFEKTQYMVGAARVELATELQLTESQVKVWFQNRRIKERKQNMETQKSTISKINEDIYSFGGRSS